MITEEKLQLKIKEFQAIIRTPEYNPAIERVLRENYARGIETHLYDGDRSMCKTYPPALNLSPAILIKRVPKVVTHKELMFDIIHEQGHAFDPVKLPERPAWYLGIEDSDVYKEYEELERQREIRAWQWADRELTKYPELEPDLDEYEDYREHCLKSYEVTWRQYKNAEPITF